VTYGFEWIPGPLLLAIVLLPLVVPGFALIGLVVIALAAVAALVALAGAIVAMPYLLVRSVRRRLAGRGAGPTPPGTEAPLAAAPFSPMRYLDPSARRSP
jgi:hypothetical protein